MFNALHFPVLKSKLTIFINKFNVFIVVIYIDFFECSKHFFYILVIVFFIVVDFEEVGLLSEEAIDFLVESFEELKAVLVSFYFLDESAVINGLFHGFYGAHSNVALKGISREVVVAGFWLLSYSTEPIHYRLKDQNQLSVCQLALVSEIE